jgi:hypothetical protein
MVKLERPCLDDVDLQQFSALELLLRGSFISSLCTDLCRGS